MTNTELDNLCERVTDYFVSEITELSNSECEYVLEQLVNQFDRLLERVREGDAR